MGGNHRISSCFLLLALLGIASGQNYGCGSSPCPQANGLFPVPNDCTAFYNCAHCTAYKQQCGPGTAFDPILHICNHIHMVDCSGSASYSQGINERKQSGATGIGYSQSASVASSEGAVDSRSSFSRRYGSVPPSAATVPGVQTTPYPYQSNHRLHNHGSSASRQSEAPARDIYQSGENSQGTGSISARYGIQQQQEGRPTHEHHHDLHLEDSQKPQEPNFNATDRGTVALSARSRFNHSHITHHPEAVSYLPTHQVVYDHSHGEHHHQSGDVHSESEPEEFSSNNRGSLPLRKNHTESVSATTESTTTEGNIPNRQGFDLKDRYVSNSGFVPSYVPERMRDETTPKDGSYGEREYVRSPNQKTQSDIRNLQGQPINPNRFYTDDISTSDADSQESPVQLNADDLRHFQQNQAAQGGVPYFEASSNADRQGRASVIQPGFRSQYQYRDPSSPSALSSAASSPIGSEVTQSERSPDASGQLFVEHKRRKEPQNNDNLPSVTTDTRGQSVPERRPEVFDGSESREHIVYVSAPALPTPLPLVAEQGRKEYHHMGYSFDHDPLRERVKSS